MPSWRVKFSHNVSSTLCLWLGHRPQVKFFREHFGISTSVQDWEMQSHHQHRKKGVSRNFYQTSAPQKSLSLWVILSSYIVSPIALHNSLLWQHSHSTIHSRAILRTSTRIGSRVFMKRKCLGLSHRDPTGSQKVEWSKLGLCGEQRVTRGKDGTAGTGNGFGFSGTRATGRSFGQTSWMAKAGREWSFSSWNLGFPHLTGYAQLLQCLGVAGEATDPVGSTGLQGNSTQLLGTPRASLTNTLYRGLLGCWWSFWCPSWLLWVSLSPNTPPFQCSISA